MGRNARVPTPDEVLLRRFGLVRAVGGAAYVVAVVVLFVIYGGQVWPLLLGVPVLGVVTTAYFLRSAAFPRTAVATSLIADALVLGGAVAFLGGTGSGLVLLYAIVVVSAGILLGPGAAGWFTALCVGLALLQLAFEEMGLEPTLLHRPELADRVGVLLVSIAGLSSVGYLSGTYASRLHELIAEAGQQAEVTRRRGRRRRSFVRRATADVGEPLRAVEAVADALDRDEGLTAAERRQFAALLRIRVTQLDAEVAKLADVGVLDQLVDERPEPVLLARAVSDCVIALRERLAVHALDVDVPPLKVVADRRAVRRVVFNLLENVVEHTPAGTAVRVTALSTAGHGVLVVSDNGPGVPPGEARHLFDAPDEGGQPRVGLPLIKELCDSMGADLRYEPVPGGGARFLVGFRLAPSGAPSADDQPGVADHVP